MAFPKGSICSLSTNSTDNQLVAARLVHHLWYPGEHPPTRLHLLGFRGVVEDLCRPDGDTQSDAYSATCVGRLLRSCNIIVELGRPDEIRAGREEVGYRGFGSIIITIPLHMITRVITRMTIRLNWKTQQIADTFTDN